MSEAERKTTLFLRGMPLPVVREAKAAAARRGSTLARYVADTLARSLAEEDPVGEETEDFERSVRWFDENRAALLRAHEGEFVAIADSRVIDHDDDFDALARRVFGRIGSRAIYMPRVSRRERLPRLRSPRLVR
jgi:hypothetical protein